MIGRTESQITSKSNDRPQPPSAVGPIGKPTGSSAQAAGAASNPTVLVAGGLVVAGVIAAAATQSGGAQAVQEQAGKAAESVKKEASSGDTLSAFFGAELPDWPHEFP